MHAFFYTQSSALFNKLLCIPAIWIQGCISCNYPFSSILNIINWCSIYKRLQEIYALSRNTSQINPESGSADWSIYTYNAISKGSLKIILNYSCIIDWTIVLLKLHTSIKGNFVLTLAIVYWESADIDMISSLFHKNTVQLNNNLVCCAKH